MFSYSDSAFRGILFALFQPVTGGFIEDSSAQGGFFDLLGKPRNADGVAQIPDIGIEPEKPPQDVPGGFSVR